ncbi:PASTA domain-containing protein [Streptomyces sp. NBC_00158]|uniref:PASTA domain-containing protein n=1 Tax=Streptomyces sp. NBC_00158 TaxID=2903627 RepID=UPI0032541DEB
MRTHHILPAVLAATALLALTGCQGPKSSGGAPAGSSPASAPAPVPAPASPTAAKRGTLPDLVGKGLQAARDEAQAAGFHLLVSHDGLGRGRAQAFDRNWKVCFQSPGPGAASTDARIDFGAVRAEESCPASDPGLPSAAAGATPDFYRKSVKAAREALPSGTGVTVKDALQGRAVRLETNWQVCAQLPKAGSPLSGGPVELNVVQFGETCP